MYDGDTFHFIMQGLPDDLKRMSVRVRGIDTPELRGKCLVEKSQAKKAKEFLTQTLRRSNNVVEIYNLSWDKYGGRIDADVLIGDQKLSEIMIVNHYARKYEGHKRMPWC